MTASKALLPLAVLALGACGTDTEPIRPSVTIAWADDPSDPIMPLVVQTPAAIPRLLASLTICPDPAPDPATITRVMRGDDSLPLSRAGADCAILDPRMSHLDPGVPLVVIAVNGEGSTALHVTVPAFDPPRAHHALTAVATPDGTLWSATVHHGLVGLTPDGTVVRYRGVPTSRPWDAFAREPQSAFVTALAPAAGRALWIGTATTGVSWFDPGIDPVATDDDTWFHGQPMPSTTGLEADLAQTTLALTPDPHDATAAWIATPNGLHLARLTAEGIDVVRVAEGPALAVAVDDDGRVWAGFSTQVRIVIDDPDTIGTTPTTLPMAPGALLVLEPGADPHDPADTDLTWLMQDEDAVTALAVRRGHTWIGTPYGLLRGTVDDAGPRLTPITSGLDLGPDLAVVGLAPSRDGLWLAARAECQADRGRLLRLDLADDATITAVHDLSERGFGERAFASVHELDDGRVIVSTLVPTLDPELIPMGSARGCAVPPASARTADLYLLDPTAGDAVPFGSDAP